MIGKQGLFEIISTEIDWNIDYEKLIFGCRAKIKVRIGDRIKFGFASSKNGQINAFDIALRNVLTEFFPQIEWINLTDYQVELVGKEKGTHGYVKVKVVVESRESKKFEMESMGADLVAASIEALAGAYEMALQEILSKEKEMKIT